MTLLFCPRIGEQEGSLPAAPSRRTFPVFTGIFLPISWPSALGRRYKNSATESRRRSIEPKRQGINLESKKRKSACMRAPSRPFEAMRKKPSRYRKKKLLFKSGPKACKSYLSRSIVIRNRPGTNSGKISRRTGLLRQGRHYATIPAGMAIYHPHGLTNQ